MPTALDPALQFMDLDYGDPVTEPFFDATQQLLGSLGNLDLTLASATTVRALAGAGADQSAMGIGGALRMVYANVDKLVGGAPAAGRFDVWVTTGPTTIGGGADPADTTDYAFDLALVRQGDPAPAGTYKRRVGWFDWDGAAITRLVQTFGRRDDSAKVATAPIGTVSALEAVSPAGATAKPFRVQVGASEVFGVAPNGVVTASGYIDSLSDVVSRSGSTTRTTIGAVGPGAVPGITFGNSGDSAFYRPFANGVQTQQFLASVRPGTADSAVGVGTDPDSNHRLIIEASGRLKWGPGNAAADTWLARSGIGALTLTGALEVTGALTRGGVAAVLTSEADLAAGTASRRTIGPGPLQAAPGADLVAALAAETEVVRRYGLLTAVQFSASRYAFLGGPEGIAVQGAAVGAGVTVSGTTGVPFYFDPAIYAVAGKATKLRLFGWALENDTAIGTTLTLHMSPVTMGGSGGAGAVTLRVQNPVAGAGVALTGLSGAGDVSDPVYGPEFDPPAAGWYMLTCLTGGAMAASSAALVEAALLRHVE